MGKVADAKKSIPSASVVWWMQVSWKSSRSHYRYNLGRWRKMELYGWSTLKTNGERGKLCTAPTRSSGRSSFARSDVGYGVRTLHCACSRFSPSLTKKTLNSTPCSWKQADCTTNISSFQWMRHLSSGTLRQYQIRFSISNWRCKQDRSEK